MGFIKVVKNKAYFKRFQVKYRRRREGKTEYKARRRFVLQDKNKYNSPKYRFVVRSTSTKIVCQVVYATMEGDKVLAQAESIELRKFGITVGLKNYPAAYCTGLLLARRLLTKLNLDKTMEGVKEATGEEFHIEEEMEGGERRPFKCVLDVGIVRTSCGNKAFGAMKGGCDGGLHIPHSTSCFAGYSKDEEKQGTYDPSKHRERIYGVHIANYMTHMLADSPAKYEMHFSRFIKAGLKPDQLEPLYKEAHKKIRASPQYTKKPSKANECVNMRDGEVIKTARGQYVRRVKLTKAQRAARVQRKMQIAAEKMAA